MHSFYASALNELEKTWQRRRTKGFLALVLLLPVLAAVLLALVQNSVGLFGGLGGNIPLMMLNVFTFALLPLFLVMSAADSFSGEEAAHTLKLTLVRPVTRAKIFAAKVLALAVCMAGLLAALWLVSILAGLFVPGGSMAGSLGDSLRAYAASFVPMFAFELIAVFIALCIKSSSGAMALAICVYAAAKLLPLIFPGIAVWSVFSYTDWYVLWVGNAAAFGKLFNTFALLASYSIMAYTAGWLLFERKQL